MRPNESLVSEDTPGNDKNSQPAEKSENNSTEIGHNNETEEEVAEAELADEEGKNVEEEAEVEVQLLENWFRKFPRGKVNAAEYLMEYRSEYKAALEGSAFDNPMDVNSLVSEYTYRDLLDLKDDMVGDVMEYQARTNKQFEKVNSINATSLPSSSPPSKQSREKKETTTSVS